MKININTFNLKSSGLTCPEEFLGFQKAMKWLAGSAFSLDAVLNGRWSEKDVEEAVTAETQHWSHDQLVEFRIGQLRKEVTKASKVAAKRLETLNRSFFKKSGNYILPNMEGRTEVLREYLIKLCEA